MNKVRTVIIVGGMKTTGKSVQKFIEAAEDYKIVIAAPPEPDTHGTGDEIGLICQDDMITFEDRAIALAAPVHEGFYEELSKFSKFEQNKLKKKPNNGIKYTAQGKEKNR